MLVAGGRVPYIESRPPLLFSEDGVGFIKSVGYALLHARRVRCSLPRWIQKPKVLVEVFLKRAFLCVIIDKTGQCVYHFESILAYLVICARLQVVELCKDITQLAKVIHGHLVEPVNQMTELQALKRQYTAHEQLPLIDWIIDWKLVDSAKQFARCDFVIRGETSVPFTDLWDLYCYFRTSFVSPVRPCVLYDLQFAEQFGFECLVSRIFFHNPLPACGCDVILFISIKEVSMYLSYDVLAVEPTFREFLENVLLRELAAHQDNNLVQAFTRVVVLQLASF